MKLTTEGEDGMEAKWEAFGMPVKNFKRHQSDSETSCANKSFLSMFIECRGKMTSGSQISGEVSENVEKVETPVLLDLAVQEPVNLCNEPLTELSVSTAITRDKLSELIVVPKKGMGIKINQPPQSESISNASKVNENDLKKVQTRIHTSNCKVEEIRRRIEGNVDNSKCSKDLNKLSISRVKNVSISKSKCTAEKREDFSKAEHKRSNVSTRDSPPRKVSFKVRSSVSNGRISCNVSSAHCRRSLTSNKGMEARASNQTSSKVAALASKFNAIIHDNIDEKSNQESKNKLVSPAPAKKQAPAEKVPVARRSSNNSKREVTVNSGTRKHPVLNKQLDTEDLCNTKDYKRRVNLSYRPSALGTKSGNVKAAIQIFEQNSCTVPSKSNVMFSVDGEKNKEYGDEIDSETSHNAVEVKKEPKYSRVTFKRDATLVRVTLDCEDICNEEQSTEEKSELKFNACHKSDEESRKLSPFVSSAEVNIQNEIARNVSFESDGNSERMFISKSCKIVKNKIDTNRAFVVNEIGINNSEISATDNIDVCDKVIAHATIQPVDVVGIHEVKNDSGVFNSTVQADKVGEKTKPSVSFNTSEVNSSESIATDNSEPCQLNKQNETKLVVSVNHNGLISNHDIDISNTGSIDKLDKQIKTKPTVPIKKSKDQNDKILNLKNNANESNYVKVMCKTDGNWQTDGDKKKIAVDSTSTEIQTSSPDTAVETQDGVVSVSPNRSFLWGTSPNRSRSEDDQYVAVPITTSRDTEEESISSAPLTSVLDDTYDDVHPPSETYSSGVSLVHGYASVEPVEDVYDDVGPSVTEEKLPQTIVSSPSDVSGVDGPDSDYEYCRKEPIEDQTYDDCEGEGYQCIGEDNSHEDAESNIYDDVKSLTTLIPDDATSISNCYESIYCGVGRTEASPNVLRTGVASSASSSIGSGNQSFCDQSNSLYGIGGSRFDSASVSQASTVSAEDGAHEVLSYQLTLLGLGQPRSETSDEWVDVEMTDSEDERKEEAPSVCQGRPRSRRSPRRSRKVRKQWSKPLRKVSGNVADGGEHSSDSDTDHHYEMLYEVVGNNKNEIPYDDFDSFDSDMSDETYIKPLHQGGYDVANGRLPEPPTGQNIYGISKIAEAAGKKMLKLGKNLRKIRNKRNNNNSTECPPLPTTPRPSPPSLPLCPVPPPRISEKSVSSGNLSGRKYWSLRKFRRSVSASDQLSPTSPSGGPKKETSTFYLTQAVDVDTGSVEKNNVNRSADAADICSENGDIPTSPSSVSSSKTIVYDSGVEATSEKTVVNSSSNKKNRPTSAPERRNSIRPNSPPPLPPYPSSSSEPKKPPRKEKRNSGNTSWYAECGLFDKTADVQNIAITDTPKKTATKQDRPSSNSWYAEVGLWDMSTSSTNDSSLSEQDIRSQHTDLSGGDSPLTAGTPENSGVERLFAGEPLYQFYAASVIERDMRGELDSDGYEEIGDGPHKLPARPSAMELIQPREGQHRTLWCEIPEVVNSRVLSTISAHQKKLQEAKFEIITSEASYINSLNVLEKHFISSPELCDESVISKNDRRILFSNVIPVKSCSEIFLAELEECWQDNILLHGICDVIYKHASSHFNVYVKYCSNQIYLDRTLRGLKDQHGRFSEVLAQLENSPVCQALSLHSFLMLPMQRITRLPLLIDAVLTRLDPQDDEYDACRMALATVNKIVQDCNEGARRMERMEEILILSHQLDFPREVKAIPIISSSRWLVKAGELIQLVWRGDEGKLTFGKKFSKVTLHLFLFTDLLFVTKKKSDECYVVLDYCARNLVQMTSVEGMSHLPVKFTADSGHNLMLLTMLQNHEKKTVEMILSCSLESDRQRWLEAVSAPVSDNPNETVYEEWDCPQVTVIHPYVARQPDELSLDVSDVVNVLRKITDGWYQGERIRDGERGWFPGNHTVEVASAHVRARNLKQRYRLLALSGNFLESQRKEKQTK